MKHTSCKGCASRDAEPGCAQIYRNTGQCPCSQCLVKSMCHNECSQFEMFTTYVLGENLRIRHEEPKRMSRVC